MKRKPIKSTTGRKAQAITEIAVFGTIILIIFAALLRYAMIFNAKQETQMYAFRKALELTQRRLDSTMNGKRQFGSVNLQVMRDVFPVTMAGGTVLDSTVADAGASILYETEASQFGGSDGQPNELDDVGGSYYQVGNKMIDTDSYIEPAYVLVKRKSGHHAPKHPWDGFMDTLKVHSDDDDEYETMQPIPYREQEQYANVTSQSQYVVLNRPSSEAAGELITTQTNTTTVFKAPAYTIAGLQDDMQKWDNDLLGVIGTVGYPNPVDMAVTTNKTLTKYREWESVK